MSTVSLKEFKPTILFLLKFIGLYLSANLLYGVFVTNYLPNPDPVTNFVSQQTGYVLEILGWPIETMDSTEKPNTLIIYKGRAVLSVYEGCNGVNTMIVFVSFLLAFGPISKYLLWFLPMGIALIHLTNLARISLLFYVATYMPQYMYFTHKYLFTAIIYAVIFVLWIWWVKKYSFRIEKK